jgi:catechol 2,3-dioxygenase-like lactoylglutathione lyase family enzyme
MNIIPIMKCRDLEASVHFYTDILDFKVLNPEPEISYILLIRDGARLDLSTNSGDGVFGNRVNIIVNNVDALFQKFIRRGLNTSNKQESPVHHGPVDQTWGMREFYVDDPDGNTLRFGQLIG